MKSRIKGLFLIGVLLVLVQFIGIPQDWKGLASGVLGVVVIWITSSIYRITDESKIEKRTSSYTESRLSDIKTTKVSTDGS